MTALLDHEADPADAANNKAFTRFKYKCVWSWSDPSSMRDVTVTKATGPFAHQTLTHAPPQTRVGRAHRTPDTPPAALHPTTRACTKPVLTQVWITRHSLALKPHVSWKQHERWWSFAGSDYWSLLSRDTQPETNQPTNSRIKKSSSSGCEETLCRGRRCE